MATVLVIRNDVWVEVAETGADKDPVELSRAGNDQVYWHAKEALVVRFANKSPFFTSEFLIPKGGSVGSGPIRPDAEVCRNSHPHPSTDHPGHYKYHIVKPRGPLLADPEIIIRD
jgi:hypothetical protein